jgi:hypothetical protein
MPRRSASSAGRKAAAIRHARAPVPPTAAKYLVQLCAHRLQINDAALLASVGLVTMRQSGVNYLVPRNCASATRLLNRARALLAAKTADNSDVPQLHRWPYS